MLKFILDTRGALLLLIIVCRITIFCSGVTTTADAEAGLEGDAVDPEFGDEGDAVVCVGLPCAPAFDWAAVGVGDLLASLFIAGGGAPAVAPGTLLLAGEPPAPTVAEELAPAAGLLAAGGVVEDGAPPAEGPVPAGTDCALPITVLKINAEITRAVFETTLNMTFTFQLK
jgi:hypothetical protein